MTVRYSDEDEQGSPVMGVVIGALAGLAVGILMAQKMGGVAGITQRLQSTLGGARPGRADPMAADGSGDDEFDDFDDDDLDELEDDAWAAEEDFDATLEERVLEAFRNDPILCECAIDIGAIGDGIIELAGMVDTERDAEHAVTVARGVPDVQTVVNRMLVGTEESIIAETARRLADGDPALTESRWEGQQVGIGRRRQGTSDEFDRHADPKPELEERWLREQEALVNAAEDDGGLPGTGNRKQKSVKKTPRGGRTDGSPVAPTGVPKADHVTDPEAAPDTQRAD